jgi:hypothetical protein
VAKLWCTYVESISANRGITIGGCYTGCCVQGNWHTILDVAMAKCCIKKGHGDRAHVSLFIFCEHYISQPLKRYRERTRRMSASVLIGEMKAKRMKAIMVVFGQFSSSSCAALQVQYRVWSIKRVY